MAHRLPPASLTLACLASLTLACLASLTLACLASLTLAACAPEAEKPAAAPSPRVGLTGAHLTESAGGERLWTLDATSADYRHDARVAVLKGVKADFYRDGRRVSTGRAPEAVFHLDDRRLALKGGIRWEATDHARRFEAASAIWLPEAGRLVADGPVRFFRGPHRLEAARLEADRALEQVRLEAGVTGVAALPRGTAWGHGPSTLMKLSETP